MSKTEEKRSDNEGLKVEESESEAVTETKMQILKLKANDDNVCLKIEKSTAIQSVTIKNLVDGVTAFTDIPLPNVSSETLAKVIEYLNRHADSNASDDDLRNFDDVFLQTIASKSPDKLFDLLLAANYLEISGLFDITCQKIADSVKELSVEDARKYFNIENDFPAEEEEKIRKENAWAFE